MSQSGVKWGEGYWVGPDTGGWEEGRGMKVRWRDGEVSRLQEGIYAIKDAFGRGVGWERKSEILRVIGSGEESVLRHRSKDYYRFTAFLDRKRPSLAPFRAYCYRTLNFSQPAAIDYMSRHGVLECHGQLAKPVSDS